MLWSIWFQIYRITNARPLFSPTPFPLLRQSSSCILWKVVRAQCLMKGNGVGTSSFFFFFFKPVPWLLSARDSRRSHVLWLFKPSPFQARLGHSSNISRTWQPESNHHKPIKGCSHQPGSWDYFSVMSWTFSILLKENTPARTSLCLEIPSQQKVVDIICSGWKHLL